MVRMDACPTPLPEARVIQSPRLEQSVSTAQPWRWRTNVSVLLESLLSGAAGTRERAGKFG